MRGFALIVGLALIGGCRGQSTSNGGMWFAAATAGLAAATSLPALVRDTGPMSCPESCPPEFACNHFTGLCDRAPCGGHCGSSQHCLTAGSLETCAAIPPRILGDEPNAIDLLKVRFGVNPLKN